jgi:hypothetical protein
MLNPRHPVQKHADVKKTGQSQKTSRHLLRASIRDADGRKYVFIIDDAESWKVAIGLNKLRTGSLVRSMANNMMPANEVARVFNSIPPITN